MRRRHTGATLHTIGAAHLCRSNTNTGRDDIWFNAVATVNGDRTATAERGDAIIAIGSADGEGRIVNGRCILDTSAARATVAGRSHNHDARCSQTFDDHL